MAVTVKTGGTFTQTSGSQPGLYVRFVQQAIAAITVGARSKVATLKQNFTGGTAVKNTVYRITDLEMASNIFGAANVSDIQYILQGGASEVVVIAVDPAVTLTADYTTALQILETYEFHIFVCPVVSALESAAFTWMQTNRTNGKNFVMTISGDNTETVSEITTKLKSFQDESVVFVANGVVDGNGNDVYAGQYACYIGGLIAGTPLDGSLTYYEVPFTNVITRYRAPDLQTLLSNQALVTVMDGDQPMIEQGLTLGNVANQQFNKIRTVRAKQAMIDDIDSAVTNNYIGKITNNVDGQIAVVNAIKGYLTTLANANVIDPAFTVALDPAFASTGPNLYINISVMFLDSIEYVFLTITV